MVTHRFTVNIPNPTAQGVVVDLRLARVPGADLRTLALDAPELDLKVVSAGMTLDPCGVNGRERQEVKLQPYSSIDVHVVIVTAPADPAKGGAAAFHLSDHRGHSQTGGVMLACVERPGPEWAGKVIGTANPCPIAFATDPYAVSPGHDPSQRPAHTQIVLGTNVDLVAAITNPTPSRLDDVCVYLEHLGISDAQFTPITWNVGALDPREVFFAVWPVRVSGWMTGTFDGSIVVLSSRTEPVRLRSRLHIGREATGVSQG